MVGPIRESVETLELTKRVALISTADLIGSIDAVVEQVSARLAELDSAIAYWNRTRAAWRLSLVP